MNTEPTVKKEVAPKYKIEGGWISRYFQGIPLFGHHGNVSILHLTDFGYTSIFGFVISRDPTVCGAIHLGNFTGVSEYDAAANPWIKKALTDVCNSALKDRYGLVETTFAEKEFFNQKSVFQEVGFKLVTSYVNPNSRNNLRVYHKVIS